LYRKNAGPDRYDRSLGFRKLNEERIVKNSPEIRGMVKKVMHLVKVLEDVR